MLEESPGSRETGRRLTAARREPRESATESKPPLLEGVRVKGWGKSPPQAWRQDWHGKPRPEQDRIGGAYGPFSARAPGVSREVPGNRHPRGMAARSPQGDEQNPAYRPSGLIYRALLHAWRAPELPCLSGQKCVATPLNQKYKSGKRPAICCGSYGRQLSRRSMG